MSEVFRCPDCDAPLVVHHCETGGFSRTGIVQTESESWQVRCYACDAVDIERHDMDGGKVAEAVAFQTYTADW